jgi:eukaryotic-like serine/threonine-protein kinase
MHDLATAAGEPVAALQARNWRVIDLLELGRIGEVEAEVDVYEREASALRLPRYGWYVPVWRSALATLRGDFELAEGCAAEAALLGKAAGDANAANYPHLQRSQMLLEQRRFAELDLAELHRFLDRQPIFSRPAWLGWLAWVHAERGELDEARAAFAELAADGFASLPRAVNWHAACEAAEACALLGERWAAGPLLDILGPHAELNPVLGRGVGCYGPVSFYLGRLTATVDRFADAVEHFEAALAACERMGARPRAALSRLRLGEALAAAGERARGASEAADARAEMKRLGMAV